MTLLAAIYCVLMILVVAISLYRGSQRRDLGFINLRMFFLVGMVYYQFYAFIFPMLTDDYGPYVVVDTTRVGAIFIWLSFLFMVSFYWSYEVAYRKTAGSNQRPMFFGQANAVFFLGVALLLAIVSIMLRFSGFIPVIGPLLNHVCIAASAASAAVVFYVFGKSLLNPFIVLGGTAIALIDGLNAIMTAFGRRPLVGVLGACLAGLYYAHLVEGRTKAAWMKIIPVLAVGMVVLTAFSALRNERDIEGAERLSYMARFMSVENLLEPFHGPDTGLATAFLIDSRPDDIAHSPLFAARYFFLHFVPRGIYEDKPDPQSLRIPMENKTKGVAHGTHTVGPGIVGHAAADGGWYAALFYGVAIGVILGILDAWMAVGTTSPLGVAVYMCSLGQTFALSRGESSIFLGIILLGIFSMLFMLYPLERIVRTTNAQVYVPPGVRTA